MVEEGLERLRQLSPELAGPVEKHHRALARGASPGSDPELTRIRFFDILSLRICLTAPGARDAPPWLRETEAVTPDGYRLPTLRWDGAAAATLDPFPFPRPLELTVPVRDLPRGPYPDQATLEKAWTEAPASAWTVRLSATPTAD